MLAPRIPVIRQRSATGLRPFSVTGSFANLFSPAEARHDRLKLKVRVRTYLAPHADVEAIFHSMGPRDEEGLFIASPHRNDGSRVDLRVRDHDTLWLLSGKGDAAHNLQGHFISAELELDVNPTRYNAHQQDADLTALATREPLEALRRNADVSANLRSLTLDQSDNIIVGVDRLGGTHFADRSVRWMALVQSLLSHIEAEIRSAFAPTNLGALGCNVSISPMQAECYWEFSSPDAISTVADLSRGMAAGDGDTATHYPLSQGGHRNLKWIKLRVNASVEFKIYAKTPDRIRLEVAFFTRLPQYAKRAGETSSDALMLLDALRQSASSILEPIWRAIGETSRQESSTSDFLSFLSRFNSAVPEVNRRVLLELLAHHRGVNETDANGVAPESVCRSLARLHVLYKIHGRRGAAARYALSPHYSQMFDRAFDAT